LPGILARRIHSLDDELRHIVGRDGGVEAFKVAFGRDQVVLGVFTEARDGLDGAIAGLAEQDPILARALFYLLILQFLILRGSANHFFVIDLAGLLEIRGLSPEYLLRVKLVRRDRKRYKTRSHKGHSHQEEDQRLRHFPHWCDPRMRLETSAVYRDRSRSVLPLPTGCYSCPRNVNLPQSRNAIR